MTQKWPVGASVIYRGASYAFPGEVTMRDDTGVVVKAYGDAEGNYSGMKHIYADKVLEPYEFAETYLGVPPLVLFADENPFPKIRQWVERHKDRLPTTPIGLAMLRGLLDNLADILNDEPKPVYSVFNWSYIDKHGKEAWAGTPERAARLQAEGVKLTPVYTCELQPKAPVDSKGRPVTDDAWRDHEPAVSVELTKVPMPMHTCDECRGSGWKGHGMGGDTCAACEGNGFTYG
jgi:hypothetical protein